MKLKVITDIQTLLKCRNQWNAVAGSRAFFRHEWMTNWFEAMESQGDHPHVIVAVEDDRSVSESTQEQEEWFAIAPFFISKRKLRFLASGTACTDYANLFSSLGLDLHSRFCEMVAAYLHDEMCAGGELEEVDCLEFGGCGKQDTELTYFCELLTAHGFTPHETETEGAWKVLLPDTFAQLNATFSKSMRRKTKAAAKRLASPETEVVMANLESFNTLWSEFELLHQKRRKFLGQPGCFACPKFSRFLESAVHGLMSEQLANLMVIYHQGTPISSVLLLSSENTCMMYQSGLDPEYSSLEPGYQTNYAAIEFAIDSGFKYFDFLRGDEPYKARWSTTREPLLRRKYVPRKLSAQIKHGTWVIGRSIKNYMSGIGTTIPPVNSN